MRVFVKNQRNEPLMPCTQRKARMLLKENKAKIVKYNPFTIQLTTATGEATQDVNVGIDTGAKYIGVAITSGDKVLAKGEIELRDGISENITARTALRKNRRNRNLRYRPARWMNRKRKDGWLPPSVQSKLDATFMWIDRFCELVPSPKLSIEVGKFDVAKMINPDIQGEDYQNGDSKGYYDVRYFVLARDGYTCQVCKKKNKIFRTHHIVYETHGGTNRADNLITVCVDCHTPENHKPGGVLYKWMVSNKKVKQYKEPVFMNIVRKRTFERYPNARITYGSETTIQRKELGLEKSHCNDSIAISGIAKININPTQYFYIKQFRKKKRSLHEATARKTKRYKNTEQKRNVKNVPYRNGFYMNDMVDFEGVKCWVYGFAAGDKSKELVLRDIDGNLILDPNRKNSKSVYSPRVKFICHNNGWQFVIKNIRNEVV